jgi:hypothetical protein
MSLQVQVLKKDKPPNAEGFGGPHPQGSRSSNADDKG